MMFARNCIKPALGLALAGATLLAVPARAEGLYGGAALGNQTYPDAVNGNPTRGSALSGKLYGGYEFNPHFALEAGMTELGAVDSGSGKVDSYGGFVDGVVRMPVSNQFSLLGRAGVAHLQTNTPSGNGSGDGLKLGLGAEYAFNKNTALRGEWERYQLSGIGGSPNADQFTLGLKLGF